MLRYGITLSLALLLVSTSAYAAQSELPKRIQVNYMVTKDGKPFAKVREQFVVNGNNYQIESTTKGIGVYALFGVRKLTSTGKVNRQGLKPTHFELHQGNNANKALFADFDWAKNNLCLMINGALQDMPLAAGTQDLASFAYQFMFTKPTKNNVTVTLTTGKKLNQYNYSIQPTLEPLNLAGTSYKTVHLVPINQNDANNSDVETKELWLAAEQNFVLVRFLMVDENGAKFEQTLTDLHVE